MNAREAARRWRRVWQTSWPRGDVEAVVALYAPECEYRALAFRTPSKGLSGVREYLETNYRAEAEVMCIFNEPVVDGDRAAVEWWASWVENGRTLTMAGATLLRFNDEGLVVDHRDYWNDIDGRIASYSGWLRPL
jgi:ketosteroid isomerase-like protein